MEKRKGKQEKKGKKIKEGKRNHFIPGVVCYAVIFLKEIIFFVGIHGNHFE